MTTSFGSSTSASAACAIARSVLTSTVSITKTPLARSSSEVGPPSTGRRSRSTSSPRSLSARATSTYSTSGSTPELTDLTAGRSGCRVARVPYAQPRRARWRRGHPCGARAARRRRRSSRRPRRAGPAPGRSAPTTSSGRRGSCSRSVPRTARRRSARPGTRRSGRRTAPRPGARPRPSSASQRPGRRHVLVLARRHRAPAADEVTVEVPDDHLLGRVRVAEDGRVTVVGTADGRGRRVLDEGVQGLVELLGVGEVVVALDAEVLGVLELLLQLLGVDGQLGEELLRLLDPELDERLLDLRVEELAELAGDLADLGQRPADRGRDGAGHLDQALEDPHHL